MDRLRRDLDIAEDGQLAGLEHGNIEDLLAAHLEDQAVALLAHVPALVLDIDGEGVREDGVQAADLIAPGLDRDQVGS